MVEINKKYFIDFDKYNYILVEKKVITAKDKKAKGNIKLEVGTEVYDNVGYFKNINSLLQRVWDLHKKSIKKDISLDEYIIKLENLENKFRRDINKINIDEIIKQKTELKK